MSEPFATPPQPIAHCLVNFDIVPNPLFVNQHGFQSIVRTPGGAAAGDYTLTLDPGLPGSVAIVPALGRSDISIRGVGVPPVTTITEKAITYNVSATPGVGANTIRVLISIAGAGTDPTDTDGDGFELILWRAPDSTFNQVIIGPLFQPVRTFP